MKVKGRGALINTTNKFERIEREVFWEDAIHDESILDVNNLTQFTEVQAKTIINRVDSPDVPADWSMNPYQGCEHGCIYCYARNTHEYWGHSAGTDFEQKIMVKTNANVLFRKQIQSRQWKANPIMLSGNTDCYQPAERQYKLSRSILESCLEFNHPIGIITKNALVCRDIDILKELAKRNLVHVHISITTLNEDLRRQMEPRTSSSLLRLQTVKKLSENGIPVNVMFAPIIPGLNSDELFKIAEASKQAGALCLSYTMLRLNGVVSLLFEDWIRKQFPLKANRVMNLIAAAQGGKLNNSQFGERMKGKGAMAEQIGQQIKLARKKFDLNHKMPAFNLGIFNPIKQTQLHLF